MQVQSLETNIQHQAMAFVPIPSPETFSPMNSPTPQCVIVVNVAEN
jgi:hypothetical protein